MEVKKPIILKPYGNIDWELERLGHIAQIKLVQCKTESDIIKAIRDVDILSANVDVSITAKVIENSNKLRAIYCTSMGVDYIDIEAANRKGIVVANLPDFAVDAVSEHAILLMFMTARKINHIYNHEKIERWRNRRLYKGFQLSGKTLGIIGFGKTGQKVAKKALGLGMNVIVYSLHATVETASTIGVKLSSLEDLLKESDIITIHNKLSSKTHHLIGLNELRTMKSTSIIINIARGAIIDEKALIQALSKGWIAGVGLDVLEKEPPDENNPLLEMDNVVITPHMAYNTIESSNNSLIIMEEEFKRLIKGEKPKNFVNKDYIK